MEMYTCWRCKGETPNRTLSYLSEHYPDKYPPEYISLCDQCSDELDEQYMFENEQTNDTVICPACGSSVDDCDYYYYEACDEECRCDMCGAVFTITANHSVTYTTKRIS